jgi:hypothetical protein
MNQRLGINSEAALCTKNWVIQALFTLVQRIPLLLHFPWSLRQIYTLPEQTLQGYFFEKTAGFGAGGWIPRNPPQLNNTVDTAKIMVGFHACVIVGSGLVKHWKQAPFQHRLDGVLL